MSKNIFQPGAMKRSGAGDRGLPRAVPPAFAHEYDVNALRLVTPRDHDFRMFVTPRYREHYEQNSYERLSASLFSTILRRAGLFVDIGASYGFYSLLAASANPELDVIAVEPTPATCTVLRRNVGLLGKNRVSVAQLAVSDTVGRRKFNVALASDSCGFFDHPNVATIQSIEVATTTVDALLKDRAPCPLIVKIDTEGNELAVLRGMSDTLRRFDDIRLLVEYCPNTLRAAGVRPAALLEELERLGFATFLLDEGHRRYFRATPQDDKLSWTGSNYANLYCVRRERALNVCFFAHTARLGGAERVLLELVDDLTTQHDAICTVVMPERGALTDALVKVGVAPLIAPFGWWCSTTDELQSERRNHELLTRSAEVIERAIVPDLRLTDPDLIWSQTLVMPWGAVAAAALGKPHVWYVTEFGVLDHGLLFFLPEQQVRAEIISTSDMVYTCSDAVRRELFPEVPAARADVLYCRPRMAPRKAAATSSLFRVPGAFRIGIFGRVMPSKGQEEVVAAVSLLNRRGHNVELVVAGGGVPSYAEQLEATAAMASISDRVHFVGQLADPYPTMAAADAVVICARNEAFGRTGVEAMLLGKPVVYAAAGGVLEYTVDGETGLSYSPGDIRRLADQLEVLIADPQLRQTMGERGRAHALRMFTEDEFAGKASRTMRSLIKSGRSSNPPSFVPRPPPSPAAAQ